MDYTGAPKGRPLRRLRIVPGHARFCAVGRDGQMRNPRKRRRQGHTARSNRKPFGADGVRRRHPSPRARSSPGSRRELEDQALRGKLRQLLQLTPGRYGRGSRAEEAQVLLGKPRPSLPLTSGMYGMGRMAREDMWWSRDSVRAMARVACRRTARCIAPFLFDGDWLVEVCRAWAVADLAPTP